MRLLASLIVALSFTAACARAENGLSERETSRARANIESGQVQFSPLTLGGGSKLTVISPERWSSLVSALQDTLRTSHQEYRRMFGEIPKFQTSVRLLDEEGFYELTGAPRWTNAMFFKGQIVIPIPEEDGFDPENVVRSLKHEFTHAVIHALSAGRCPGWLDEGLAQWAEGSENPALQPALARWLSKKAPVPLSLLQGGFTKLDSDMVPPAYAQSLFATHALLNTFGVEEIGNYFRKLRDGDDKPVAFESAFAISERSFEKRLGITLKRWASKRREAGSEGPQN